MGAGGVREPGGWRPSAERLGVGGVREPGGGETRDRRARPAQGRARKYEVTENNGRKGGLEATPGLVEGGAGLHQRPAMGSYYEAVCRVCTLFFESVKAHLCSQSP